METSITYKILVLQNGIIDGEISAADYQTVMGLAPRPKPEPKPEPKPDPIPSDNDLIGEMVGLIGKDKVYVARAGRHYYQQLPGGILLPRGTNLPFLTIATGSGRLPDTNASPANGGTGVPQVYALPVGWGWKHFEDGAWYIVREKTAETGPAWLSGERPLPDVAPLPKPDGGTHNNRPPEPPLSNNADDMSGETDVNIYNPLAS